MLNDEFEKALSDVSKAQKNLHKDAVGARPKKTNKVVKKTELKPRPKPQPQPKPQRVEQKLTPAKKPVKWQPWVALAAGMAILVSIFDSNDNTQTPSAENGSGNSESSEPVLYRSLGIIFRVDSPHLVVDRLEAGLSGEQAGLRAGDRVILYGDDRQRVSSDNLRTILNVITPAVGERVYLAVEREGNRNLIEFNLEVVVSEINHLENFLVSPISSERAVPIQRSSDPMFENAQLVLDDALRETFSVAGLRKMSRQTNSYLYDLVFSQNSPPSGIYARDLQRIFNYGYCDTTDFVTTLSDRNIARMLNTCVQNQDSYLVTNSRLTIAPAILDFMYQNSSARDYLLFASRDGQASRDDIFKIQTALNRSGFDVGHADGIWSRQTSSGLISFLQSQDVFINISEEYLDRLRQNLTADNRDFITNLALSRARIQTPLLRAEDFQLR
ncbi:MAG: PDZ domain-containing protein [Pseudomonadota bacterium]